MAQHAMAAGPEPEPGAGPPAEGKGLKSGAIGVVSATVIGVASTAPAYSMAATLGLVAVVAGVMSPAIMLVAFIPMLFTASAYYYLNRADPDCGATFSWVTRAMGPSTGWMSGWAIVVTDIIVMPSLAYIAAQYTFLLFGLDGLAANTWAIMALGCAFILAMTLITWLGIELSARTQFLLLAVEIVILAGFSAWALVRVFVSHPAGSITPSIGWLNPFGLTSKELIQGVLFALFIYWGWDTAANVNEETRNGRHAAGVAVVTSTFILVGTYVIVAFAATALKGPGFLGNNPDDVLTVMASGWWEKLLILAVLSSAMASTQTTIMPTARTTLSMAVRGALPKSLGKIHPKYLTPTWSTWWMGIASVVWYVLLVSIDHTENILWDTISGLGFGIAFYYGLTALAAPIYYRHFVFKGVKNFLLMGAAPLLGAAALFWVFYMSAFDPTVGYWYPKNAYTSPWFAFGSFKGVGAPFVIGVGSLVIGLPLMLLWRWRHPKFFHRKLEAIRSLDEVATDVVTGEEPAA